MLAAEVVVHRASRQAGSASDLVGGEFGVPLFYEQPTARLHEGGLGGFGVFSPSSLDSHADKTTFAYIMYLRCWMYANVEPRRRHRGGDSRLRRRFHYPVDIDALRIAAVSADRPAALGRHRNGDPLGRNIDGAVDSGQRAAREILAISTS